MAVGRREIRIDRYGDGRLPPPGREEPPIGELFRQLSDDASQLIRQEVALAKAELRQTAKDVGRDAAKLGVAATLGWFGAMAAVAFLILALGALIESYWLSSLIVAVLFLGIAAILANNAKNDLQKTGFKPTQTMATLEEDKRWAKQEVQDFKRDLRT